MIRLNEKKLLKNLQELMEKELWAATVYKDHLKRSADKKVKELLAKISEYELRQAVTLTKEINKIKVDEGTVPAEAGEELKIAKDMLKEKKSIGESYKKMAKQVKGKRLKELFRKLGKEEKEHGKEVDSLISYLKKKGKK